MQSKDIRNIALVGHHGTGKTTLAEALLFKAGALKQKGSIAAKNTVADQDPDEKERGCSVEASILHCLHLDKRINLIDCPGIADYIGSVAGALSAVNVAFVTVNASAGVEVSTRKHWGMCEVRGIPRVIVVTKMDHERAKFDETVAQLREAFGTSVAPVFLPVGSGAAFKGVVNLLGDLSSAPPEAAGKAKDLAGKLLEAIVAADDKLMERYLNDEKLSPQEIAGCFEKALLARSLTPVVCVAGEKDLGTQELLAFIAQSLPGADTVTPRLVKKTKGKEETRALDTADGAPFYALCFKSKRDAFIGKISYLRVFSGTLSSGTSAHISSTAKGEKFAHFLDVQGKDTKEIAQVHSGEIFAIAKHEHLNCGDTVTVEDGTWEIQKPIFPVPMSALAVQAKNRNEDAKVSEQLRHLAEGDPTFKVEVDHETHELVIHGMGQLHLELMLHRLKRLHLEVDTRPPKIPYRSTINGAAESRHKHKKQSGGSGQFGEVQIVIEPNHGKGYEFVDEIVGGVIPHNLIPSVDKGIQKKMHEGVWPGILVVDVRVRLVDGKSHPVDSKDIAFQIAGREAFKEAFLKAKPALIEPVVHLEVGIPSKFMGDITGHLSSHRGKIQGMDQMGDLQIVKAQVPMSELLNYSAELKAMTGGEGFFSMEFSHYDTVPSNVAHPVIAAAMSRQVKEEE
ncbi:MAG: elongation factor G [Planctomycetota bacterium]|nr:elongation factor G [Planctomycetota bacterium]